MRKSKDQHIHNIHFKAIFPFSFLPCPRLLNILCAYNPEFGGSKLLGVFKILPYSPLHVTIFLLSHSSKWFSTNPSVSHHSKFYWHLCLLSYPFSLVCPWGFMPFKMCLLTCWAISFQEKGYLQSIMYNCNSFCSLIHFPIFIQWIFFL